MSATQFTPCTRSDRSVCALKDLYRAAGILPAEGYLDLSDPVENLEQAAALSGYIYGEPTDLAAPAALADVSPPQAVALIRRVVVQIEQARV